MDQNGTRESVLHNILLQTLLFHKLTDLQISTAVTGLAKSIRTSVTGTFTQNFTFNVGK